MFRSNQAEDEVIQNLSSFPFSRKRQEKLLLMKSSPTESYSFMLYLILKAMLQYLEK